jgi:hypothetical protein
MMAAAGSRTDNEKRPQFGLFLFEMGGWKSPRFLRRIPGYKHNAEGYSVPEPEGIALEGAVLIP